MVLNRLIILLMYEQVFLLESCQSQHKIRQNGDGHQQIYKKYNKQKFVLNIKKLIPYKSLDQSLNAMKNVSLITMTLLCFLFTLSNTTIEVLQFQMMAAFSQIHTNQGFQKILVITPSYTCPTCSATVKYIFKALQSLSLLKKIQIIWVEGKQFVEDIQIKVYKSNGDPYGKLNIDNSITEDSVRDFINKYINQSENGKRSIKNVNGYSVEILQNSDSFLKTYQQKINEKKRYLKMKGEQTDKAFNQKQIQPQVQPQVQVQVPPKIPMTQSQIPTQLEHQSIEQHISKHERTSAQKTNKSKKEKNKLKKTIQNLMASPIANYLMILGAIVIIIGVLITIKQRYRRKENFMLVMNEQANNLV